MRKSVLRSSVAYEASRVLKDSGGILIGLMGYNKKTSDQFVMVFNTASVPSNGAIPVLPPIKVPASSNFSIDVPVEGFPFSVGITAANSSTDASLTIGSADVWFSAVVK